MKTITILGLATLLSTGAFAQQLINQKDPFSGKQIKSATIMPGGTFGNIGQMFAFAESDGKKYVSLTWMPSVSGTDVQGVNFDNVNLKQCSILLLMDDNSIMKFNADSTLSKKSGFGPSALLTMCASVSVEQLRILSTQDVKTMRLGLTDQNVGVDLAFINDKVRRQVKKAAMYILDSK